MGDFEDALRLWRDDASGKAFDAWVAALGAAGEVDRLADLARALHEGPTAPYDEARLGTFDRTVSALAVADPRTMLALLRDGKLLGYQVATHAFDAAARGASRTRLEALVDEEAGIASRPVLELLRDLLHAAALFGADLHRARGAPVLAARLAEAGTDAPDVPFAPHPLEARLARCVAGTDPWPVWAGTKTDRPAPGPAPVAPKPETLEPAISSSFDDLFSVRTSVWRYPEPLAKDALPRSRRDIEPHGDLPPMRDADAADALCLLFRGRRQGLASVGDARRHAWGALASLAGASPSSLDDVAMEAERAIWSLCATPGEIENELATIWIQTLRADLQTVATVRAWYDKYR